MNKLQQWANRLQQSVLLVEFQWHSRTWPTHPSCLFQDTNWFDYSACRKLQWIVDVLYSPVKRNILFLATIFGSLGRQSCTEQCWTSKKDRPPPSPTCPTIHHWSEGKKELCFLHVLCAFQARYSAFACSSVLIREVQAQDLNFILFFRALLP